MNILKAALASMLAFSAATPALAARTPRTVEITVTKEGFVPAQVKVRKGEAIKLVRITNSNLPRCTIGRVPERVQIAAHGHDRVRDAPRTERDHSPVDAIPLRDSTEIEMEIRRIEADHGPPPITREVELSPEPA